MKADLLAVLAALAVGLAGSAWAGPRGVVRTYDFANGSGTVDYGGEYVEATATGTVDMARMRNSVQAETVARRTARHLAYEVLAETVGRIQIDAKTLYQDAIATMDALKTETHAVIRGALVVSDTCEWTRDRMSGGEIPVAKVTLRLSLRGEDGLEALLDRHLPPGGGYRAAPRLAPAPAVTPAVQPAVLGAPPSAPAPAGHETVVASEGEASAPKPAAVAHSVQEKAQAPAQPSPTLTRATAALAGSSSPPVYDALVLDTRGVAPGYEPALRLYIKDENGNVVFGPATVRPSIEREGKRAYRYASSVDEAEGFFPEAKSPLVVKAATVRGPGELVLRAADARAVAQANAGAAFLREARVAVVLE